MGQRIEIDDTAVIDDTVVITTNRSFTGTAGEGYESAEGAGEADTFAGNVAAELFESNGAIQRVYVDQNALVITIDGGWDSAAVAAASRVIEDFFLYYPVT